MRDQYEITIVAVYMSKGQSPYHTWFTIVIYYIKVCNDTLIACGMPFGIAWAVSARIRLTHKESHDINWFSYYVNSCRLLHVRCILPIQPQSIPGNYEGNKELKDVWVGVIV